MFVFRPSCVHVPLRLTSPRVIGFQVAIGYQQLGDGFVKDLPVGELQDSGLLFIWVINAKYRFALQLMKDWGYKCVQAGACASPPPLATFSVRFV